MGLDLDFQINANFSSYSDSFFTTNAKTQEDWVDGQGHGHAYVLANKSYDLVQLGRRQKGKWAFLATLSGSDDNIVLRLHQWRKFSKRTGWQRENTVRMPLFSDGSNNTVLVGQLSKDLNELNREENLGLPEQLPPGYHPWEAPVSPRTPSTRELPGREARDDALSKIATQAAAKSGRNHQPRILDSIQVRGPAPPLPSEFQDLISGLSLAATSASDEATPSAAPGGRKGATPRTPNGKGVKRHLPSDESPRPEISEENESPRSRPAKRHMRLQPVGRLARKTALTVDIK
jgi:hypothetical protein